MIDSEGRSHRTTRGREPIHEVGMQCFLAMSALAIAAASPARLVLSPVLCGPLALLGVCSRPPCLPPPTHALSGNFEPKREVRLPQWQVRSWRENTAYRLHGW